MINNLQHILPHLSFENKDYFYHLQILKRKKENPDLGSNSRVIKTYYISSAEYLLLRMDEIISLCELHNARACINLNRRSYEQVAYQTLRKVADQILNKDFSHVMKAYDSVCGTYSNEPLRRWIVDIDTKDQKTIQVIQNTIKNCEPERRSEKVLLLLETKHGVHLITTPFNMQEFKAQCPDIDVHKDNPTILYMP